MPLPSSDISMKMFPSLWNALSQMVPTSGLPRRRRSSGDSMPWSMELRIMCFSGSLICSMTFLSSSVSVPLILISIFLPSSKDMSLTTLRKRLKVPSTGTILTRMTCSCRSREILSRADVAPCRVRDRDESVTSLAHWVMRATDMTISPTRFTSLSSLSVSTRMVADLVIFLLCAWARAIFSTASLDILPFSTSA